MKSEVVLTHTPKNTGSLAFSVRRFQREVATEYAQDGSVKEHAEWMYEATTPYRNCVWTGYSQEEAVGAMLKGVAEMARDGSINPARPADLGAPPIQHAIELLTERLMWQSDRRREKVVGGGPLSPVSDYITAIARDNEILAGLATAIAALARVKDL